ncbi:amidase [Tunturibacter empetritectus]|uniref:Aspartyl-tRNA(Asn)/glutamyl-tRNA(Gln) amidotransferase subunit A n=1 Tax=Tunturiibacter empetritectus TaxID=3069691 RepID=A0A7W8IHX7_9BACT|nr:amidase family protein [Edaphobacter lichenicola]MBB5317484.1 aspartyl-tRNA(Asn)/glutamyl-tRNA(Gln) amidotransferase subunit A [Edaphobacter lichenicola]
MTTTHSPLSSLRHAIASSETEPHTIASTAAGKANSNASHNTYLTLITIESLRRAEQLPNLFAEAQSRPPLYGIPISLKDCFDLAGTATSCGSRYYLQLHPVAAKNSWVAQRLLDAGAIIPGKTHLHQLAYGITGENADYDDCVQPRDATLLTGGSSSGAAASVQEGSALAAIGTDTGGSVRVPAALCGLAGYRASHAVSRGEERWSGAAHLAPSFDTLGLLFRDLRDGPALASAIYDIPSIAAPTQLRIGYVGDEFTYDCEPEPLAAFTAWKQHLLQHGATLTPIDTTFWTDSSEIFTAIQASEAAQLHRGHYQHFEPAIAERLIWGASITNDQLQALRHRLEVFRSQMSSLFQQVDLLLIPCAPVSRLLAGNDQSPIRKAILRYTTPASLAGLPAVTLAGEAIGAPFGTGMQLVAAPMQDAALLTFAASLTG